MTQWTMLRSSPDTSNVSFLSGWLQETVHIPVVLTSTPFCLTKSPSHEEGLQFCGQRYPKFHWAASDRGGSGVPSVFRPGGQLLKLDLENGFYDVSIVEASHNCNWASDERLALPFSLKTVSGECEGPVSLHSLTARASLFGRIYFSETADGVTVEAHETVTTLES